MPVALQPDIAARLPEGFQEFLDQLVAQFDPERVILFGSRARGEATEESDTDVLVVMPCGKVPPLGMAIQIRKTVQAHFPMDLVVLTPEYVEAQRSKHYFDFVQEVDEEGVVLHERASV